MHVAEKATITSIAMVPRDRPLTATALQSRNPSRKTSKTSVKIAILRASASVENAVSVEKTVLAVEKDTGTRLAHVTVRQEIDTGADAWQYKYAIQVLELQTKTW